MNSLINFKYILIGFGKMGERYLNLLIKEGVNDIFVIEKKKDRINFLTSKFGIHSNKIFKNLNHFNLQNKISTSIAIISTTADNRLNIIKKLSDMNIKYIFCEKPIARSIKEALSIKKLCKDKNIHLSINHPRRFSNETKKITDLVKNKNMGKLISYNFIGANVGIAMVGIHFIEAFLYLTKSKILKVYGNLEENKFVNPRGRKFKDYNGYIFGENKNKQKIIINTSEEAGHGCFVIYTYQKGIIVQDIIGGKIFINMRKKIYSNEPTYKYALPYNNINIKLKNSELPEITKIALKKFIKKKNFITIEDSLEALKVVICSIQSSKLKKEVKIKNINKNLKYNFA